MLAFKVLFLCFPVTIVALRELSTMFFFQRVISKLVDYPLETDDGTEDFNATSDHNPYYQPPQEESNVSNLTRCKKRNSAN